MLTRTEVAIQQQPECNPVSSGLPLRFVPYHNIRGFGFGADQNLKSPHWLQSPGAPSFRNLDMTDADSSMTITVVMTTTTSMVTSNQFPAW